MSDNPSAKAERPLSPHLQVYKPQLTSVTSILHRATGVALSIGVLVFAWWLVSAAIGPEAYAAFMDLSSTPLAKLCYFGWTVAFYYHFANGIRHLIWDAGLLFKIKDTYRAGYFVLFVTAAMTGVTWYCILEKMPAQSGVPVTQTLAEAQDMEGVQ